VIGGEEKSPSIRASVQACSLLLRAFLATGRSGSNGESPVWWRANCYQRGRGKIGRANASESSLRLRDVEPPETLAAQDGGNGLQDIGRNHRYQIMKDEISYLMWTPIWPRSTEDAQPDCILPVWNVETLMRSGMKLAAVANCVSQ
jgi:hypothetical protein